MTKRDLAIRIAAETGLTQLAVKEVLQKFLDYIIETLARKENLEFRNFGVFEVKHRAARKARNPRTNQEVLVPAKSILSFQPGKNVAARIAQTYPVVSTTDAASESTLTTRDGDE